MAAARYSNGDLMQRLTLMMAVVFVTLLGAPTPSMVSHSQAATTANVSATDPSGIDALEYERAAVTLDGRVLFQVRGLPAYPANERAKTIRQRIEEIADDSSVSVDSLRMVDMEDRTRIAAGDRLVAGFIDADGAAEGVPRQLLAERATIKIKQAIASYRNDRSPRVLLIHASYALGATALLALVLFVVRGVFRKLDALAESRLRSRIEAFETQSYQIVQARQLRKALDGTLKALYLSALVA